MIDLLRTLLRLNPRHARSSHCEPPYCFPVTRVTLPSSPPPLVTRAPRTPFTEGFNL